MTVPADEAWKVMICAEEAKRAKDALSTLTYILAAGQPGDPTYPDMLAALKERTGYDIARSIEAYVSHRVASVQVAISKD